MQIIREGAVTGIRYSFFPNKPTSINNEDVKEFIRQGFVEWKEPSKKKKKRK